MGFLGLGNKKATCDKTGRGRHLLPSSLSSPEPLHRKLSPSRSTNVKLSLSMDSDDSLQSPIADSFTANNASGTERTSSSIAQADIPKSSSITAACKSCLGIPWICMAVLSHKRPHTGSSSLHCRRRVFFLRCGGVG